MRSDPYQERARALAVEAGLDPDAKVERPGQRPMPLWCTFRDAARKEQLAREAQNVAADIASQPQAPQYQNSPLLLSDEHFSVDGTLIEDWDSMKSLVQKDRDDRRRERAAAHAMRSATSMAKRARTPRIPRRQTRRGLFRKGAGKEAKLCHMGHLMTENSNGLIVDARLTEANGTAERTTALDMIEDNARPGSTVGGDKNYDTADFVAGCRERGCTPHVSQNDTNRRSAIDSRTTRHRG